MSKYERLRIMETDRNTWSGNRAEERQDGLGIGSQVRKTLNGPVKPGLIQGT